MSPITTTRSASAIPHPRSNLSCDRHLNRLLVAYGSLPAATKSSLPCPYSNTLYALTC